MVLMFTIKRFTLQLKMKTVLKNDLLLVSSHHDYINIKNNLSVLTYIKRKQTPSFDFPFTG